MVLSCSDRIISFYGIIPGVNSLNKGLFFMQAISKFESLVNQVQKNAKDINNRLAAMEKTVLFKRPPKKNGIAYLDAKVSYGCQ